MLSGDVIIDYSVVVCSLNDAENHLASSKDVADNYDVILLDLSLPDASGLESVESLVLHSLNAPIIVMTGNNDESVANKALSKGVQDYLVKGRYTKS